MSIGESLGRFEIVDRLGRGGMGEVWRGRDPELAREVALKVIHPRLAEDEVGMARFEREALALAALNHPSIATLFEIGEDGGQRFLVMELVEGRSLDRLLERGPLPVPRAIGVARRVAEGLEAAHAEGILHRDLKPGNVMVGERDEVKILDFGLAKPLDRSSLEEAAPSGGSQPGELSEPGRRIGTAGYMSPEQVEGRADAPQVDFWSFGVVLGEMLTGRRAFPPRPDVLESIRRGRPEWGELPEGVPPALRELLERCLDRDPSGRPAEARELVEVLRRLELASRRRRPSISRPALCLAGWAVALFFAVAWWRERRRDL